MAKHSLIGSTCQMMKLGVSKDSRIRLIPGSMVMMNPYITMKSQLLSGDLERKGLLVALLKALKRIISGEKMTLVKLENTSFGDGIQEVIIAPNVPGEIVHQKLSGDNTIYCRKGAFLCSDGDIDISFKVIRHPTLGILSKMGFILQHLTGSGHVYFSGNGSVHQVNVTNEVIVDAQNLVAFSSTLDYEPYLPDGKSMLFSGEGMMMIKLSGDGRVWLQAYEHDEVAKNDMIDMRKEQAADMKKIKRQIKAGSNKLN